MYVSCKISGNLTSLGERLEAEVNLRNDSEKSASILSIEIEGDKALRFEQQRQLNVAQLHPSSTLKTKFWIIPKNRGTFHISEVLVRLTDSQALFQNEVHIQLSTDVKIEVESHIHTLPSLTPLLLYGNRSAALKSSSGEDFANVREFASGDDSHRIAWKKTARYGKLMVEEFYLQTEKTISILIDHSATMQQQSYVGTKFEEALSVAQLILELGGEQKLFNIIVYDETEFDVSKQASASTQLAFLATLTRRLEKRFTNQPPVDTLTEFENYPPVPYLAPNTRLRTYLQILHKTLIRWSTHTGIYKALQDTSTDSEPLIIIITDLETNLRAMLRTASKLRNTNRVILAQIGSKWRLSTNLEAAYLEFERNIRRQRQLSSAGLTVIDVRPEKLLEGIAKHVESHTVSPTQH